MTHDYKRKWNHHSVFLRVSRARQKVIGDFHQRHRHQEFLSFLRSIDRKFSGKTALHLVMDNYGTHSHANVKTWLDKHPRFVIHYVPTSCRWLNLIERWFAELTNKRIRRDSFLSVDDLIAAIEDFLAAWNENPKPFVWTATVDSILAKLAMPPDPGTDPARLHRTKKPKTFVQLIRGHYSRDLSSTESRSKLGVAIN